MKRNIRKLSLITLIAMICQLTFPLFTYASTTGPIIIEAETFTVNGSHYFKKFEDSSASGGYCLKTVYYDKEDPNSIPPEYLEYTFSVETTVDYNIWIRSKSEGTGSDSILYALHSNTAGGSVKFVTDSPYIAINVKMDGLGKMPHFALTGSIGFDLYVDNYYAKTFVPPFDIKDGYEIIFELEKKERREITINFPLYSNVCELFIGLQDTAYVSEAEAYKNDKPIVYYGSSITQGGCASRPGMSYQAIVSRTFDYDYINLGFSGSAKAEDEMIEYIKNLDMSAFVYDYDHNAPSVEHLARTHEKMFKAIREKNPLLPVIMMSRPKHFLTENEKIRRSIIETTYLNAVSAGEKCIFH